MSHLTFEEDIEPYALTRDSEIKKLADEHNVKVTSCVSHTLFDPQRFVILILCILHMTSILKTWLWFGYDRVDKLRIHTVVSTSCYLSVLKNNLKEWWQGSPNIPASSDCVVKPWFSPQTSRQPIRWTAHTQMAMTVFCNCRIWLQKMKLNCISILITQQIL